MMLRRAPESRMYIRTVVHKGGKIENSHEREGERFVSTFTLEIMKAAGAV